MMLAAALLLLAASPAPAADAAVRALESQQAAWNRGDLEAALDAYCNSPSITWVNRGGVTRGFEVFAEGMRHDFADSARMGRFDLEVLDSRQIGADSALVAARWSISRDGERLMGGVSTQLWQPCRGELRIVFEHAG